VKFYQILNDSFPHNFAMAKKIPAVKMEIPLSERFWGLLKGIFLESLAKCRRQRYDKRYKKHI